MLIYFNYLKEDVEAIWNIYLWLLMAYGGDSSGVGMVAVLEIPFFEKQRCANHSYDAVNVLAVLQF